MLRAIRIVRYAARSLSVEIEVEEFCAIMPKVRYLRGMGDDLKIEFQTWEGTGNTFVIVNGFKYAGNLDLSVLEDKVVQEICFQQNTKNV